MYMSYCRFEGALQEMRACMEDVREHSYEQAEYEVSDREIDCFRTMVRDFTDFLREMELVDEDGCVNEEELDRVCESMSMAYGEDEYYEHG